MDNINDIELVRMATAGSVDDGKSTLIGRLFYDTQTIPEDQMASLEKLSKQRGLSEIDLSLLTDGLAAEREQGITIDVAYRHFSTIKRRFLIADVPGHEEYTGNMATGSSTADLILILIDAKNGITSQSKRHLFIASLLRVCHILIVVNKMDAIGYSQEVFKKIKEDFTDYISKMNIHDLQFIPVSALKGDMVTNRGNKMGWYQGSTLLSYLENLEIQSDRNLIDFRFPVQSVIRADDGKRYYAGKIEGGTIKKHEKITILPSIRKSKIKTIFVSGKEKERAFNPQSAALSLEDELDISRGDIIVRENNLPEISDEFIGMITWFSNDINLKEGDNYLLKSGTKILRCSIEKIIYSIDIDTLHREKGEKTLQMNDIGKVKIKTHEPIVFDFYSENKNTGNFIIIDEFTNDTAGAGIILDKVEISEKPAEQLKKKGAVLWFTGLSGAGKTTIADELAKYFSKKTIDYERLDGDVMRKSLSSDLGFSITDRDENIKRATFMAHLLSKHDIIVLAAFISPTKKQRQFVKSQVKNFIEIFVDASIEVCAERDTKGLYEKAKYGKISDFTGFSSSYEKPANPDIHIETSKMSVKECVNIIIDYLKDNKIIC